MKIQDVNTKKIMITKHYKIAGCVIAVTSFFEQVHKLCRDYETDEPADFSVTVTESDIAYEKQKSDSEYAYEGRPLPCFSDAALEETAVYRKIAEKMIDYDTVVFHGSAIAAEGVCYLFTAKSGTGKSTHTRLWRELLGEKAVTVNDDKPMLRVTNSGILVCGTPYNGKHGIGTNIAVPLKAICILTRSEENHIARITKPQAYPMLLQQVYRPQDPMQMTTTLKLIDIIAESAGLFRLGCNMELSAAELAYNEMKG